MQSIAWTRWPAYQGAQDKACAIQLETFVSAMKLIIFKIENQLMSMLSFYSQQL